VLIPYPIFLCGLRFGKYGRHRQFILILRLNCIHFFLFIQRILLLQVECGTFSLEFAEATRWKLFVTLLLVAALVLRLVLFNLLRLISV